MGIFDMKRGRDIILDAADAIADVVVHDVEVGSWRKRKLVVVGQFNIRACPCIEAVAPYVKGISVFAVMVI
jgi:hypothetical protein